MSVNLRHVRCVVQHDDARLLFEMPDGILRVSFAVCFGSAVLQKAIVNVDDKDQTSFVLEVDINRFKLWAAAAERRLPPGKAILARGIVVRDTFGLANQKISKLENKRPCRAANKRHRTCIAWKHVLLRRHV